MSNKQNRAARLHAIATELGVDPELVGVVGKGIRNDDAIRDAVRAHLAATAPAPEADDAPKKKKAGLTLSQRRALLRLLDEDGVAPATAFKALPYEHLVEVGYAVLTDGTYTLTDEGVERAEAVNPGYRVWSAGETVVLDADGQPVVRDENGNAIRPPAGTARAAKATTPVATEVEVQA